MPDIHLNAVRTGSVISDLPFKLDEKRPSTVSNLDNLLGQTWDIGNGGFARLVRADGAQTSPGKLLFKYSDTDVFDVLVTTTAGDTIIPCGVAHENLEDLADNDFFFLIGGIPGSFVKCVDSGSGSTAGNLLQATAAGEVVVDAAQNAIPGVTFGKTVVTAIADADTTVMLIYHMLGTVA